MAKAIENENYTVKEWSVYSRQSIGEAKSEKEFYNKTNKIRKKNTGYKWSSIEDVNHHLKLVGVYKSKEEHFVHRIIITGVNNFDSYTIEVANEVKSYQWNRENINTILAKIDYPANQESSFYSIKGESNGTSIGKRELVKNTKKLMENLSATEIESLVEDDFSSFSGLSTKWDNSINLDESKKMNLQIAMRFNPSNDKLNVTVGTPIITTEY
ncbi:YwmB family TATA-box binding protein [Bacillus sp. FJAT-27231]|uniref:YwmB family TATA-box binding protein n=1 Tax=Bacillus sp. FJAT-27231 TaxID=1679168 RepID=UPI0018CFC1BD|nr:YwmB family TATA-box binding protein [Bacillus sp. FJAT-27231]